MLRIPGHLADVVLELAEAHLGRVSGDVRVIEAIRSRDQPDVELARRRLQRARELVTYLRGLGRAVA